MKSPVFGLLCLLAACSPAAPMMNAPDRVDSFCAEKEPRGTAIASIVASTDDEIVDQPYPTAAALRHDVKTYGGVIGHWDKQPFYHPAIAKQLGVDGPYLNLTEVVIDNQLEAAEARRIYVTVDTPAGPRRLILRAHDIQNACVEGTRLS